MSSDSATPVGSWLSHGAVVLCLGAAFYTLALLGVATEYSLRDRILLALLYLGLAALLHGIAQLGERLPRPFGVLGSLPLAAVLVWHFREQTGLPASLATTALILVICLAPVATLERLLATRSPLPLARLTALAAVLVAVIVLVGWYGLPTLRWHLLRHNTLFGTPLYYLLAPPVPEVREELHAGANRLEGSEIATVEPAADAPPSASPESPESPDLVFVLVDTLRADALSDWGGSGEAMPQLEELARSSIRFTDLVANSSWTRPSIASMFTGLLPEEHGARDVDDPIAPEVETLAQRLSGRGYRTVAFQTNVGAAGQGAGFARGFDLFRELPRDPYARAEEVNREVRRWLDAEDDPTEDEGEPGDVPPLFLYLHYLDPHEPYLSGDFDEPPVTAGAYLERYDAELAYFDRHLAEMLTELRQTLGEDTVVLVTSDHGEEFFEHGLFGHGHSLYDEVVEIPLLVHRSGAAPATIDARLEGRDLFDLVLALSADSARDLSAWAGQRARERRYLSLEYTGSGRLALRPYRRYNLMRALDTPERRFIWSGYGPTRELYDQRNDPRQLDNRIEREPENASALEAGLDPMVSGWRFPEPIDPSDEALEQLRALGYVD